MEGDTEGPTQRQVDIAHSYLVETRVCSVRVSAHLTGSSVQEGYSHLHPTLVLAVKVTLFISKARNGYSYS